MPPSVCEGVLGGLQKVNEAIGGAVIGVTTPVTKTILGGAKKIPVVGGAFDNELTCPSGRHSVALEDSECPQAFAWVSNYQNCRCRPDGEETVLVA